MALSSSNISPTCRANEADVRSALQTKAPAVGGQGASQAGAYSFREFVAYADSAPAPQIAPLPGNGSDEQMFGEKEQVRHGAKRLRSGRERRVFTGHRWP